MDIEELRARLAEAESNLQAIYSGEIDALLLADENGERRVFTLRSADAPYRALVERMQEGAATLSVTGDIVYCNQRFADLVKRAARAGVRRVDRHVPAAARRRNPARHARAWLGPLPDAADARRTGSAPKCR